ncbi:hypothetical protein K439DRAFT_1379552 [Ramaria rubella]|nr:hypothetical protein K439DRAFT_1379552 [Ramaria rubella]
MPVDRRKRGVRHELAPRRDNRQFAVQQNAVSQVKVGSAIHASGNDILTSLAEPEQGSLKKKEKQQLRHDALLQRLGATSTPYSKSHMKRLKRRAKEDLSTDLAAVGEAIAAVETRDSSGRLPDQAMSGTHESKPETRPGQIGERKHGSLTRNQRKRALQMENLRHKLIMANTDFSSNPFRTIRTHAENTLVKHKV